MENKIFLLFTNFRGKNNKHPSPIKTIFSIKLEQIPHGFLLIFHGDGFLYKMVRNITGALMDIGEKKVSLAELSNIIQKKTNIHGLKQAPSHGLCLESVDYN